MPREEYIEYYRRALNMSDDDFDGFCDVIDRKLPYSFRIPRSAVGDMIRRRLERYPFVKKVSYLEDVYEFNESDDVMYKEFIRFLVGQTSVGWIQRQEIVSMIPILLMDIKSDSKVLDMCAAPGSKTKQILEIVNDGLVVANDVNGKRLNILVTETSKVPNSSLIITNHDASSFPRIYDDELVKFDRVLCDVVCSSDGTMRKNPNVLNDWSVCRGKGLFSIQYRILKRGCEVVSDDGLVGYSTCSLNPLENECVVQKVLMEGEFELVGFRNDPRLSLHPDGGRLMIREGLKTWEVSDEMSGNNDYKPSGVDLGLEKCIRLYPHDQNTGGFFIAILRRASRKSECDTGSKRNEPEVKRLIMPPNWNFLSEEDRDQLFKAYSIPMSGGMYRRTKKNNVINIVSSTSERILKNNPKLKVVGAGYKILEKSGLDRSEFYLKNMIHVGDEFPYELILPLEKFRLLLMDTFVQNELLGLEHVGLVIVRIEGINITLCGYGNSNSFTLFMSNDLRRALKDLIE